MNHNSPPAAITVNLSHDDNTKYVKSFDEFYHIFFLNLKRIKDRPRKKKKQVIRNSQLILYPLPHNETIYIFYALKTPPACPCSSCRQAENNHKHGCKSPFYDHKSFSFLHFLLFAILSRFNLYRLN